MQRIANFLVYLTFWSLYTVKPKFHLTRHGKTSVYLARMHQPISEQH